MCFAIGEADGLGAFQCAKCLALRAMPAKLAIAIEALERCKHALNVTTCEELRLDDVLIKVRP